MFCTTHQRVQLLDFRMPDQLKQSLADAMPVYEIPDDNLIGEVLIPAMLCAKVVDVASGFFSSQCLAQIAPGLADLIARDGRIRLLVSTTLSAEDLEAVERGIRTPENAISAFAVELLNAPGSQLAAHAVNCLAYLIATERLQIRFVLMRGGMYHKKQWLFHDGEHCAAVHGSGNATGRGLLANGEQMTVDRPWLDGVSSSSRVSKLVAQFERQWNNEHQNTQTVEPIEVVEFLKRRAVNQPLPVAEDFWAAWWADAKNGIEPCAPFEGHVPHCRPRRLAIPIGLDWHNSPYAHQAEAIDCLEAAGGSGILAVATGGGKTRIAMIAVTRLQDRESQSMLVVVLVPSIPLANQWVKDIREFGIMPYLLSGENRTARETMLTEASACLQGSKATVVLIVSNQLFTGDDDIRKYVERHGEYCKTVLIGDEVHNLGAPSFLGNLPEAFQSRIGLSATPIRQYDPDGTDNLFGYFMAGGNASQPVFTYTLEQAINDGCLVPYRYWVHPIIFTGEEMDKYEELTDKICRLGFKADDDGRMNATTVIDSLLRERRALIEQAENKIAKLRSLLVRKGPANISRTLVYASAKPVKAPHADRQIDHVTRLLGDLGVISHQFTSVETTAGHAQELLEKFGRGDYQVLTAMKVLDEGIDVPQTNVAYLLASSTVQREWVQRRGRILRRAEGKAVADLHDFLVVPPDVTSANGRCLLNSEYRRVVEFGRVSSNEYDPGGAVEIVNALQNGTWGAQ